MFGNKRGMALLLVVSVISLLVVVVLQFGQSMQLNLTASTRSQQRLVLESMAHSGIDIGIAALRVDAALSEHDSLLDNWAVLGENPLPLPFGQVNVALDVVDLSGRLPINRLVPFAEEGQNSGTNVSGLTPEMTREMLSRLLLSGAFELENELQALEIIDSIVDWIDANDGELPYGAETSYYQSLENPYRAKNGYIEFIDELLLIKGITPEILYGTDETTGLAEYITVHNREDGRININTAPLPVLMSIDDRINEEDVAALDEFRTAPASFEALASSSWYLDVTGWPGDVVLDDTAIATQGSSFMIRATTSYQERSLRMHTVVNREDADKLEIVHFRMD